jgi:riboflavin kinase/FMN adenylyltransferase
MRIFRSIDIGEKFKNPVLTIGNYDGLHLGHKRIIERVKERARELDGTSMLMTFDPHPLHVLKPERELAAITPEDQKERVIEETGIDVLFVVPFTEEFSRITPEAFVRTILVDKLAIKGLVIGYDFRFGSAGKGDVTLLEKLSRECGFFVEVVGAIAMGGGKVGSNRVRSLLTDGDVAMVARLLGRSYMIAGRVVRAKGRGRSIGFPTINLQTDYPLIPKNGVYVTEVEIEGHRYGAVTNIGYNPTFENGRERFIETFILDFEGDLYDREVRLRFLERIRDEERFASVDGLKARIAGDVETARAYFGKEKGNDGRL